MVENNLKIDFDAFLRSFKQNRDGSFAFLLGAGASITSGIQSAEDCVWDWKKQIYISNNPSCESFLDIHADYCKKNIQMWLEMPHRVVIHKRSPFKETEIKGITDALSHTWIKNLDLVTITMEESIRCIPNRNYFPGGRGIPSPLKITKYYGKGSMQILAREILGFTKMNWNSFNFYTKFPATIDTSNTLAQVGNLLGHYNGRTYDYRYFI